MSDKKTVKSPSGFEYNLLKSGGGLACALCGKPIDKDAHYAVCSDCGGIFCEGCVIEGRFEGHNCENDDLFD